MRNKNVFGVGSDDDEGESKEAFGKMKGRNNVNYMLEKMNNTNKLKMVEQANKYLMEDPTIYDYDGFYDDINSKRQQLVEKAKKERGESRYLDQLKEASEKRKREQSIIKEKIAEKELQREDTNYGKKEKYVTESYRKLLEANKNYEQEVKKKEEFDQKHSVNDKKDMNDFWRNMYDQNIINGVDRPDINKEMRNDKQTAKREAASKVAGGSRTGDKGALPSEDRVPTRSRSRSRSLSHEKYEAKIKELENFQKENERRMKEAEKLEKEQKEKEEAERRILEEKARKEKAVSAKERFLQRKVAEKPNKEN